MSKRYTLSIALIVLFGLVAGAAAAVAVQWQGGSSSGPFIGGSGGAGGPSGLATEGRWWQALRALWPAEAEAGAGVGRSGGLAAAAQAGGELVRGGSDHAMPAAPPVAVVLPEPLARPDGVAWLQASDDLWRSPVGANRVPGIDDGPAGAAFARAADTAWGLYQLQLQQLAPTPPIPEPEPQPVPEPATGLLWLVGLAALARWQRRRRD